MSTYVSRAPAHHPNRFRHPFPLCFRLWAHHAARRVLLAFGALLRRPDLGRSRCDPFYLVLRPEIFVGSWTIEVAGWAGECSSLLQHGMVYTDRSLAEAKARRLNRELDQMLSGGTDAKWFSGSWVVVEVPWVG